MYALIENKVFLNAKYLSPSKNLKKIAYSLPFGRIQFLVNVRIVLSSLNCHNYVYLAPEQIWSLLIVMAVYIIAAALQVSCEELFYPCSNFVCSYKLLNIAGKKVIWIYLAFLVN